MHEKVAKNCCEKMLGEVLCICKFALSFFISLRCTAEDHDVRRFSMITRRHNSDYGLQAR